MLVSYEIPLARPFSDEGQVAKHVNLLVYTRDAEEKGLSATVRFRADSCVKKPVVK